MNGRMQGASLRRMLTRSGILFALDTTGEPAGLTLPGFGLHALSGDLVGFWSIVVSRNWRIVFRFENGNATDVDLVDYH